MLVLRNLNVVHMVCEKNIEVHIVTDIKANIYQEYLYGNILVYFDEKSEVLTHKIPTYPAVTPCNLFFIRNGKVHIVTDIKVIMT